MLNYKLFVESVQPSEIGIFPGAFKPPHKGHFLTAKTAAQSCKSLVILVSSSPRDNITPEKSYEIWNIYKKYLPSNIDIKLVSTSPITATYQIVDIINNGKFTPTLKVLAPSPEAKEVADLLLSKYSRFKVDLYTGKEDALTKYNAFFADKTANIYKGKNVIGIVSKDINRVTSATKVREALKNNNINLVKTFLPEISEEDKDRVIDILQS